MNVRKELPLLLVVVLVAGGLVVTTLLDRWRVGSALTGLAFCVGAALRLTLPSRQAGLLVVRSRGVDASLLLTVGLALVALANTIPAAR